MLAEGNTRRTVLIGGGAALLGAVALYGRLTDDIEKKLRSPYISVHDIKDGSTVYARSADQAFSYPASIVKMLTIMQIRAEMTIGRMPDGVVIQQSDLLPAGYSNAGLAAGDKISWQDALYTILMVSAGEVCNAAARTLGNWRADQPENDPSGYTLFTEKLNAALQNHGALSSHVTNAHGAPAPAQIGTAHDYARIVRQLARDPDLGPIARTRTHVANVDGPNARRLPLENMSKVHNDPRYLVGKGGDLHLPAQNVRTFNLCAVWRSRAGRTLAISTMGAQHPLQPARDHKLLVEAFGAATA